MALARTARGVERTATEREGARRAIIFNANGKVKCRMNEGGEGQSDGGAWSLRRRTRPPFHSPYPSPGSLGLGGGAGRASPSPGEGGGRSSGREQGGRGTHRHREIGFFNSRSLNLYLHTLWPRNRMYQREKSTLRDEEVVGSHLKSEQRKGRSIPQTYS